jgi:hypothetical protein
MRYLLASSIPHVSVTGANSHTYITILGALLVIIGSIWLKAIPKWLAVCLTLLATAAALSTPGFGPWLQHELNSITSGFLGRG